MSKYSLSHLSDSTLLHDLAALVARDRATTAALLAHLAEVDARKLYLPAAYPSMYAYCVGELRLSEDCAWKRIQVARAARRFPAIFAALADGRLHLSAACLLAPHLAEDTADDLLVAATHKSKAQIEQMLAGQFPKPDVLTQVQAVTAQLGTRPVGVQESQLGPGSGEGSSVELAVQQVATPATSLSQGQGSGPAEQPAPGQVESSRPRVTPLAPERFALQVTIGQSTHDKLRYAQSLLGHQLPSGDIAQVLDRALDALIRKLEGRKFGASINPRRDHQRPRSAGRYIPAHVRRAVWEQDQGQCTFVSETGHRCAARKFLEFDHVDPVACGGQATASRMRLRCRAHNQYEAERRFGAGFMSEKRERARNAATARTTDHPAVSAGSSRTG